MNYVSFLFQFLYVLSKRNKNKKIKFKYFMDNFPWHLYYFMNIDTLLEGKSFTLICVEIFKSSYSVFPPSIYIRKAFDFILTTKII